MSGISSSKNIGAKLPPQPNKLEQSILTKPVQAEIVEKNPNLDPAKAHNNQEGKSNQAPAPAPDEEKFAMNAWTANTNAEVAEFV